MRKSSPAQLAASRRNGARSRGPLSDETRSKVARNALKHGLTSSSVVLDREDPERFQELLDDLIADFAPQTSLEFCAIEEMAAAKWRQRRAWQIETAALNEAEAESSATSPASRSRQAWRKLHSRGDREFESVLLLGHRLDSQFDRALKRFLILESQRLTEELPDGKIEPETH